MGSGLLLCLFKYSLISPTDKDYHNYRDGGWNNRSSFIANSITEYRYWWWLWLLTLQMVADTSVLEKHYLDVMGSASSLDLPLLKCAELVRCANRARCPLTILGDESYYHGRSKSCVTNLNAKIKTILLPAYPPSVSLPIPTLK